MKKKYNFEECVSNLNKIKQMWQLKSTDAVFDKKTALDWLETCGLPTYNNFWRVFTQVGIIKSVSRGMYCFVSKDPIYIGKLGIFGK